MKKTIFSPGTVTVFILLGLIWVWFHFFTSHDSFDLWLAVAVSYPLTALLVATFIWRIEIDKANYGLVFHKLFRQKILSGSDIEDWGILDVTYYGKMNFTTNHFFKAKLKKGKIFEYQIIGYNTKEFEKQAETVLNKKPV